VWQEILPFFPKFLIKHFLRSPKNSICKKNIYGIQGGVSKAVSWLLDCYAIGCIPDFERNVLPPFSGLK
jgi:hypothetical protein